MKRVLCALLTVVIIGLLCTGCQKKSVREEAFYAACDNFVAENTDNALADYRADGISYKIYSFEESSNNPIVYPNGYLNVEIVWYIDISGEFDEVKACQYWMYRITESLSKVDVNGTSVDVQHSLKTLGDSLTIVVNNKYAYTEQDYNARSEYTGKPPQEPHHSSGAGLTITLILLLIGFGVCVVGIKLQKGLWALIGAIVTVPCVYGVCCLSKYRLNVIWTHLILFLLALGIATVVIWRIIAAVKKKNDKLQDFYESCVSENITSAPDKQRCDTFRAIAANYGYMDFQAAIDAVMQGKQIQERRKARKQDKEFSVPLVTGIAIALVGAIVAVIISYVPSVSRWVEKLHSSWIIVGCTGIIIGIYSIVFAIHYYVSGEARRVAEEKARQAEFWSKSMAHLMVMVEQRGGNSMETLKEVSGYNARVAQDEANEIINSAILGGAIGGTTGAMIGAMTAKQNIEVRKK